MANILDYLDWRGDLTLAQAPFNEVDNLLLAELAFVDFRGIVPENGQSVLLRHAAAAFFARHGGAGEIDMGLLVPDVIPVMLRKMAASRRFGDMKLSCYEDRLDVGKAEQFAALAVDTGDGALYLAFRGTDDTLAGWKEDFLLSCMPEVPAQKKGAEYTLRAALLYPGRWLRLGGHSKGGNLAVYAAPGCRSRCRAALPPSTAMTAPASSRNSCGAQGICGWNRKFSPSCPSPPWWVCCWNTAPITPWWIVISWAFSSMTVSRGR